MRKTNCPSDISRKQFEQLTLLLESASKKTNSGTVDLYEVFCAVLYLLRGGLGGFILALWPATST